MQRGYLRTVWDDVKNSPGWFGKLALLSLVGLVPVFGWIVVYGYVFGWARDIAWNVHAPLPARVLGNEDGRLYSRGFFALVIFAVCMLVPWAVELAWTVVTGASAASGLGRGGTFVLFGAASFLFSLIIMAARLFVSVLGYVGAMRMSIYGRLAPGFQLGRIWAMVRYDAGGLARILGMGVALSVGASVAAGLLVGPVALAGMALLFGVGVPVVHTNDPTVLAFAAPALVVLGVALFAVIAMVAVMAGVFSLVMITRALGYWTRQFDVPSWGGQDDPLPFERRATGGWQG